MNPDQENIFLAAFNDEMEKLSGKQNAIRALGDAIRGGPQSYRRMILAHKKPRPTLDGMARVAAGKK